MPRRQQEGIFRDADETKYEPDDDPEIQEVHAVRQEDKLQHEKARKFREDAMVIVGAWRTSEDPVWNRVYYYNPYTKNATFDVYEVLASGGMEDLLRNLEWTLCILDPKDYPRLYDLENWVMDLYDNSKCAGKSCGFVEKGSVLVVIRTQFDSKKGIQIAQIVNPLNPRKFVYAKIGEGSELSYLRPIIGVRNDRREAMMDDAGIDPESSMRRIDSMMNRVGDKIDPNDPYNVVAYLEPEARYYVCTQNRSENLVRRGGWYQSRAERDKKNYAKLQMTNHHTRRRKLGAAAVRCFLKGTKRPTDEPFVLVYQFEEAYGDKLHEIEHHFNDEGSFLVLPTELNTSIPREALENSQGNRFRTALPRPSTITRGAKVVNKKGAAGTQQEDADLPSGRDLHKNSEIKQLGFYGRGDTFPGFIDAFDNPVYATDNELGELASLGILVIGKSDEEFDTHHAVRRLRTILRELSLVQMPDGEFLKVVENEHVCRPGPPKSFTGPIIPFSGVYTQQEVEEAAEQLRQQQEAERLEQERLRKLEEEKANESSELSEFDPDASSTDEEEDFDEEDLLEEEQEELAKAAQGTESDVDSDDSDYKERKRLELEEKERQKEEMKKQRRKEKRQQRAAEKAAKKKRREEKLARRAQRAKDEAARFERERLEEEWRIKNQLTWFDKMQMAIKAKREEKERLVLPMLNKSPDRRSYHELEARRDIYHDPVDPNHHGLTEESQMNIWRGPPNKVDPLSPNRRRMDFRRLEQAHHLATVAQVGEQGLSLEEILTERAVDSGDQAALQGQWNQKRGSGTESLFLTSQMESPDRKDWANASSEFWDKERNRKRAKLIPLPGEVGFGDPNAEKRRLKRLQKDNKTSTDVTYSLRELEMMNSVLEAWKFSHPWKTGKVAEPETGQLMSTQIMELGPGVRFKSTSKGGGRNNNEGEEEENNKPAVSSLSLHTVDRLPLNDPPIRIGRMGRMLNYVPTEDLHENALRSRWGRVVGWEPKPEDLADIAFPDQFDSPTSPKERMQLGTARRVSLSEFEDDDQGSVTMTAKARNKVFQEKHFGGAAGAGAGGAASSAARVKPAKPKRGANKYSYLAELKDVPGITEDGCVLVTESRDFHHSRVLGRLQPNTQLSFLQIVGSRAQIAHVYTEVDNPDYDEELDLGDARVAKLSVIDIEADNFFRGGWVSLVLFETGEALFSKILPLSEVEQSKKDMARTALKSEIDMKLAAEKKAQDAANADRNLSQAEMIAKQTKYSGFTRKQIMEMQKEAELERQNIPEYEQDPKQRVYKSDFQYETAVHANNMVIIQRETVTGGWREARDVIWNRTYYLNPGSAVRATWDLREVLHDGGLEDLLISQTWHLGIVGEASEGVAKDESWQLEVFDKPIRNKKTDDYSLKLPGERMNKREIAERRARREGRLPPEGAVMDENVTPTRLVKQGRIIVLTELNPETGVAKILLPQIPTKENVYASKELMDLCDPANCTVGYTKVYSLDKRPLVKNLVLDERGTAISGVVFLADFPERVLLPIQEEQDIESEDVAFLRGGDLVLFSVVAGIRARVTTVPKLPGMPIEEGWVTLMLPDGKPLFREQMQQDRIVKEGAEKQGSSVSSHSTSTQIEKQIPTVQDGFVLRWGDRMRLAPNELQKVAELVTDDHYQEFIIQDVKTLKTLSLPYEKGKHRSHLHITNKDRELYNIEQMLKSGRGEERKIGVQKLEELARKDLEESRQKRIDKWEQRRQEEMAKLSALNEEEEKLKSDDMADKVEGRRGVGGQSGADKLQEAKIQNAEDAVKQVEEENARFWQEEFETAHMKRDYWESDPEVVSTTYDLQYPKDRIEDANVMSSLAKGYLNKIRKAALKFRMKALPIEELPYHELGGIDDRHQVFQTLPELMQILDHGRQLCDWKLTFDVTPATGKKPYWKNLWTDTRATMQQLLASGAWKLHIVTNDVEVFEDGTFEPEKACSRFTKGCVLLVEWVQNSDLLPPGTNANDGKNRQNQDDVCRVLCPPLYSLRDEFEDDDDRHENWVPQHGYCPFVGFFQPLAVSSQGMFRASIIDEMLDHPGDFVDDEEVQYDEDGNPIPKEENDTGDVEMGTTTTEHDPSSRGPGRVDPNSSNSAQEQQLPPNIIPPGVPQEQAGGSSASNAHLYTEEKPKIQPIPNPYDQPMDSLSQLMMMKDGREIPQNANPDHSLDPSAVVYRVCPFGSHVSDEEVNIILNNDFRARLTVVMKLFPTRKSCLRHTEQQRNRKTGKLEQVKRFQEFRWDVNNNPEHFVNKDSNYLDDPEEWEGAATLPKIGNLLHDDEIIIQHVEGRYAYVLIVKMKAKHGYSAKSGWVELVDEFGNCYVRMIPPEERLKQKNPYFDQMLPETQKDSYIHIKGVSPPPTPSIQEEEDEEEDEDDLDSVDRVTTPAMSENELDGLDVTQVEKLKREKKSAVLSTRKAEEERLRKIQEEAIRQAFLDNMEMLRPHILPILLQMSELVDKPVQHLSDYKECRDPIWGRKYFLNIWTSEVCYNLQKKQNVPFVRMFLSFVPSNIHSDFFTSDHKGCRKTAYQRIQRVVVNNLEIKSAEEHLVKTKIVLALQGGLQEELGEKNEKSLTRKSKDEDKKPGTPELKKRGSKAGGTTASQQQTPDKGGANNKTTPGGTKKEDENQNASASKSKGTPKQDPTAGGDSKDKTSVDQQQQAPNSEQKAEQGTTNQEKRSDEEESDSGAAFLNLNNEDALPDLDPEANLRVVFETKIDLGALNTLYPARRNELEYLCGEEQYLLQGQFLAVLAGLPEIMRYRLDPNLNVGIEELSCRFVECPRSLLYEEAKQEAAANAPRRKHGKKQASSVGGDTSPTTAPPSTARSHGDLSSVHGKMPEAQALAFKEVTNNLKFRTPKVLNLSKKPLGLEGAVAIQQGFMNKGGKILQELCLWGCGIGNEGAEIILEYLPETCRVLWLDDNDIVSISDGVIPEGNSIEELYLASNRLGGGESLPYILRACPHLQILDVARNEMGSNRIVPVFDFITGDNHICRLLHLNCNSNKIAIKCVRQFLDDWNRKRGEEPEFKFEYLDVRYNQMDDQARKSLHFQFTQKSQFLSSYDCVFEVLNDPLEGLEDDEDGAQAAKAAVDGGGGDSPAGESASAGADSPA
ncbi:unnamed protein product [Amoebophrya sp. A120]|nr:unnamed protein product [Amoebophrya sp. A120]|eukprot:GSA120T00008978001.1